MLGALYGSHICFRARVSTCGKWDPKDRGCREPASQLKRRVRKGDMVTCLIQIVDKPDEVILSEVLHAPFIFLPVKRLVEPIGELG